MLKESGGSPVTYLNKGSRYSISVEDTLRAGSNPGKKVYCTSVQVVFDTEQQRQQPLAYWQLWEQNRDDDEVRSFEGRSQAIEYVGPHESDPQDHMMNLQVVHSDGFSLITSVDHNDTRPFSISIRLNFRSTDFSHCKGVIGATMQLCSRTEEISTSSVQSLTPKLEVSFCRIKSFRSHGAERKNVNDKAIAEKRIRRLQQQLAQSQTHQTPKDKRLGRDQSKTPRLPGARRHHEDGLLCKIKNLQQDRTSTQPYTFLDNQGEKQQDCDWPPAAHGNTSPVLLEAMTLRPKHSVFSSKPVQRSTPPLPWYDESQQRTSPRDLSERIQTRSTRQEGTKVACFYIRPIGFKHISQNDQYIAVYLFERTACHLTRRIAEAVSVDASLVGQTIWSTVKGFSILVDDDVVANMMEGQNMLVEAKATAPRSHSGGHSSLDSADEVDRCEHVVSQGARELIDFNLMF